MAVGQEAVIADALKTGRDGVLEEAADELVGGKSHDLGLVAVAVVLPLEGDHAVFQFEDAPVGDRDTVGVAAEILQHVLGSTEGRFGVDHPFLLLERRQVTGKGEWICERSEVAEELEFSGGVGLLQGVQKQSAEELAEDLNGEKEFAAARDPAFVIGGQATGGDNAVEVRMEVECLSPTMQYGKEAGGHAEMLGIGGNRQEGLGGGVEENVVDEFAVGEGNGGDGLGQGEDDVEVVGG